MAITSSAVEVASATTVAEPAAARSLWLSTLPRTERVAADDRLPQLPTLEGTPGDIGSQQLSLAAPTITMVGQIATPYGPIGDIAVSPDGHYLVVTHPSAHRVSIIDTSTIDARTIDMTALNISALDPTSLEALAHEAQTCLGASYDGVADDGAKFAMCSADISAPTAIAVSDHLYVSSVSVSQDYVVAIDTSTGIPLAAKSIPLVVSDLAVAPAGDVLYVGCCAETGVDIAVVDVETGASEAIILSAAPTATLHTLAMSTDAARLYAALSTAADSAVVIIDLYERTVIDTVTLSGAIDDIAVHPNGRMIYVTGWNTLQGGVIHSIDTFTASVVATVALGGSPTQLALGYGGTTAYLLDGQEIIVVDTKTHQLSDSVIIGGQLCAITAGLSGERLYVADYDGVLTALAVSSTSG